MTIRTCTTCKHRGADVNDVGQCFFCVRALTVESARLGHALLLALGRRAPAADAEAKAERKQEGKAKVYHATPDALGLTDARAVYDALVGSEAFARLDEAAVMERFMVALAIVRGAAFKSEQPWTYTVGDCVDVRALVSASYTPAQLARAIVAASKTPFWREQKGITFKALAKHIGSLLAAQPSRAGTATKERRAEVMESIAAKLKALDEHDPITAIDFHEVDLSRMDVGSLAEFAGRVDRELQRWVKG